ncbi:DUF2971 domain-containing protein, partial [Parabacteroides sp. OttesenSCG-928-G21]|nr:DUF2971 domain-containing protein [Parabacteroides sp. OttesenSCG-928-G21]
LKNRTIRFNRLDRVDDIEEASIYEQSVPMGKYTFVSCWTNNEEESIPLWKMYTPQMKGVRLSIDSDMFQKKVIPKGTYQTAAGAYTISNDLETFFSPEEQFNEKYAILYHGKSDPSFFRAVEYVDDYKKHSQKAIAFKIENTGIHLNVDTGEIGKYKNKRWAFQEEVRFALTIVPMVKNLFTQNFEIIQAIQKGIELPINYYDLSLDENIFSKIKIMIGPCCCEADQAIIESLVKNFNPTITISPSKLSGTIRK